MNKATIATFITILCFTNAHGKIAAGSVKKAVKKFEKKFRETVDAYIISPTNENLEILESMLPPGPQKGKRKIEKDVHFSKIEKNEAAIEILNKKKEKLDKIEKKINETKNNIKNLLEDQKKVKKKWKKY